MKQEKQETLDIFFLFIYIKMKSKIELNINYTFQGLMLKYIYLSFYSTGQHNKTQLNAMLC